MNPLTIEQRSAWIDEVLQECLSMNYKTEQACMYFINELFRHLRMHPTQLHMYVTMHATRIETTIECHAYTYSGKPSVITGRGNAPSYPESVVTAFCEIMLAIVEKYFYTEMTAKMFLLYLEHYTADLEGLIAGNNPISFFASVAGAWHSIGAVHNHSTGIHDATTRGYGAIDVSGFWFIGLPDALDNVVVPKPGDV